MKTLTLALFFAPVVFAQDPMNDPTYREQKAVHADVKKAKPKKHPDQLRGQCVVIPGGGNLIAVPCTDVILTLKGKGDPIQARTDKRGEFEFVTEQGEIYSLTSGSKFYTVVEPTGPIRSGDTIEVQLKQKEK